MTVLVKADDLRLFCLGEQMAETEKPRMLKYVTTVPYRDNTLLYNSLTDELLSLTQEEVKELEKLDAQSEICQALIKKWFLVPEEFDDKRLCDQIATFSKAVAASASRSGAITSYTIFPTTDCNARCFYCYEKGRRAVNMTPQAASDVADWMIKKACGEQIKIRWFGGEPLYNYEAIDIISAKLKAANADFRASMITNGYLFDEALILKARENWNLKKVQITLDGTEEIYNRCKNFVYGKEINAFKRVTENIERLLNNGITVKIRLNMDEHNADDLFDLVDFIAKKYSEYKNISIYPHLLFDESGEKQKHRPDFERAELTERIIALHRYIERLNLQEKTTLDGYIRNRSNQCMADNASATTVLPEGQLGKCEHFSENEFWGSIYSEEINSEVLDSFKKYRPHSPECDDCKFRTSCIALEKCPDMPKACKDYTWRLYQYHLEKRILNTAKELGV